VAVSLGDSSVSSANRRSLCRAASRVIGRPLVADDALHLYCERRVAIPRAVRAPYVEQHDGRRSLHRTGVRPTLNEVPRGPPTHLKCGLHGVCAHRSGDCHASLLKTPSVMRVSVNPLRFAFPRPRFLPSGAAPRAVKLAMTGTRRRSTQKRDRKPVGVTVFDAVRLEESTTFTAHTLSDGGHILARNNGDRKTLSPHSHHHSPSGLPRPLSRCGRMIESFKHLQLAGTRWPKSSSDREQECGFPSRSWRADKTPRSCATAGAGKVMRLSMGKLVGNEARLLARRSMRTHLPRSAPSKPALCLA